MCHLPVPRSPSEAVRKLGGCHPDCLSVQRGAYITTKRAWRRRAALWHVCAPAHRFKNSRFRKQLCARRMIQLPLRTSGA
jgi:hypothetical protein